MSHHDKSMKPPLSATNLAQLNSNTVATGVTYAGEDKLPRLPIPDLKVTLERFQERLAALQTESQREETATVVNEFLQGDGPKLYDSLREYEATGREAGLIGSYVEEFWNESYLSPDASVVLNLNPFFVLEGGPDPKIANNQLHRAASLCFAAVKMASVLRLEKLTPDSFRGVPLCMHQFKALFSSSRQPTCNDLDDVHVFNDSTHVAVLCKNQFYYFFALWPDTSAVAIDESDVRDILSAIQEHAKQTNIIERSRAAIGVFTSLPRSKWAIVRQDLCGIDSNQSALRMIDSALFVLVLDDYIPNDIHSAAANMLHGTNDIIDTRQVGSCLNRWHDKLQLIVCGDGTSGLSFEHSIIDGHTALRFVSDVFAETVITFAESIIDLIHGRGRISHVLNPVVERAVDVNIKKTGRSLDILPKKLVFELPESILQQIYFAETTLCDEIHASETHVLEYKHFGKRFVVSNKMSPDAVVQMSILLAYYRLYGKVECMYEPALTKQFFHGRTEAIRGTTVQAKKFCEVWCNAISTRSEKLEALRLATTEHSRLTKEATSGQGVDRILFAMKCIASRSGESVPPFFRSEAWETLNRTVLSTSNCGNPALRLFGFGPVVPNGFGIGYIIKDDGISFSVSTRRRQTQRYVQSLEICLSEIQELLQPISTVSVDEEQPSQIDTRLIKKSSTEVSSSYGDIWGENESIVMHTDSKESRDGTPIAGPSVMYSPRIHEQSIRGDLLSVSSIDVLFQ